MKKIKKDKFLEWLIRDKRVNFEARWENSRKRNELRNLSFSDGTILFKNVIEEYIREAYESGKEGQDYQKIAERLARGIVKAHDEPVSYKIWMLANEIDLPRQAILARQVLKVKSKKTK